MARIRSTLRDRVSLMVTLASILCAFGLFTLPSGASAEKQTRVRIRLNRTTDGADRIEVVGLSRGEIANLRKKKLSLEEWQLILSVAVRSKSGSILPPMLGEHRIDSGVLLFEPRYPLKPGLQYRVVFRPARLPGKTLVGSNPISQDVSRPKPPPAPPTKVVNVFPSRNTLPENQLKFYIHFSAPMRQGEGYQHISLLDGAGKKIEYPFLEFGQELWDNAGIRFTLYLDPGRVKRGLQPRELFGPVLEKGKTYSLVIDRKWHDAADRPLSDSFRKKFKVVTADYQQPNPKQWKLTVPAGGTTKPLIVQLDEPLDQAMLEHVLFVIDAQEREVPGTLDIGANETRWSFQPKRPWKLGTYDLVVDTRLEDLAGNSIGRPFEVDLFRTVQKKITTKTISLSFQIEPKPPESE